MAYNKNQTEPLKPTQRWLHHHLLHPFWVTLLSPRPHPPASASKPKWLQMMAACLPSVAENPFFRRRVSSRLTENKRSLIHQMLHLPQPTLLSDAVIFTSPHAMCEGLSFFFFFFTFFAFLVWLVGQALLSVEIHTTNLKTKLFRCCL